MNGYEFLIQTFPAQSNVSHYSIATYVQTEMHDSGYTGPEGACGEDLEEQRDLEQIEHLLLLWSGLREVIHLH